MKKQKIILTLLIVTLLGFTGQQTFAQKKGKSKMIIVNPTKQLIVEVTITGSGSYTCLDPGRACTWRIDRKYSATIALPKSTKVLSEDDSPIGDYSTMGAAEMIALAKAKEKTKVKRPTYNIKWYNIPTASLSGGFTVNVSINDEKKETWKEKTDKNTFVEKSKIETWTASNVKGNAILPAEVTLDRQRGGFRVAVRLSSDAIIEYAINGEKNNADVFDVPMIVGKLESPDVFIPFERDNEKTESFEEDFYNLKGKYLGIRIPEEETAAITVKYKFY